MKNFIAWMKEEIEELGIVGKILAWTSIIFFTHFYLFAIYGAIVLLTQ